MAIETLSTIITILQNFTEGFKSFFMNYGLSSSQAIVATVLVYLGISAAVLKLLTKIMKWVFILLLVWLILSVAGVSVPLPFKSVIPF